ncbi:MAG: hypothetical protein H7A24_15815 [Leptospiraceae bacterium]|nr:hypothetical protein [Leptospiraceae bacterium]
MTTPSLQYSAKCHPEANRRMLHRKILLPFNSQQIVILRQLEGCYSEESSSYTMVRETSPGQPPPFNTQQIVILRQLEGCYSEESSSYTMVRETST